MKSTNAIVQEVAQATMQVLLNSSSFSSKFDEYPFAHNIRFANGGNPALYFYPTTINEVKRQFAMLTQMTGSQFKFKFPCILLVLDTPVVFGDELPKAVIDVSIVTQSNAEWPSYDRDIKVFEPVLRPIADEFIKQLAKSKYVVRPMSGFKYTYIERYNTSVDLMKESVQLYGASVDAIELIQLQIPLTNLDC